jgi:predicted nucleic acid-binding protein
MTSLTVIDASVAIKWFVDEELQREEALTVLDQIQAEPQTFLVPELFFNEMLSVLCKLLDHETLVQSHMRSLENLGLTRIGNGSELLAVAARIAVHHNLTGYDAIYAATAKLAGAKWLTADKRAHKRLESIRVSRTL